MYTIRSCRAKRLYAVAFFDEQFFQIANPMPGGQANCEVLGRSIAKTKLDQQRTVDSMFRLVAARRERSPALCRTGATK
jgi:hypothetical protein